VKPLRDKTWEVVGDVTVHGTTKRVTLQAIATSKAAVA
jgi:polyisoprenoid-binding protein YceI